MKRRLLKGILKVICILFSVLSTAQTTYYVDSNKPDNSGLGTSWSTAKRDLQIAINTATTGDEIWVKAGTYLPTHDPFGSLTPANNRDKTFTLKNGVKVYGGFSGTENLLSQRNWQTNLTTLSGDLGTLNTLTDNSYHVVISVNLTAATILDGVTITKGYATAPGGSLITVDTRVIERYKGGGIFNTFSATIFSNCTIKSNSADCTNTDDDSWGAGVVNDRCSSAFTNCIIDSNSFLVGGSSFGVFGAGMIIIGGSCSINSCVFSNNTSGSGFLDASRGGALDTTGTVSIVNTVFYNNSSQNGAALQFGGSDGNTSTVTNCSFVNNTSSFAGTAYSGFSKATFKNCIFWNNPPTANAGIPGRNEIYSQDDRVGIQPTFQNCIIRDATGSPLTITNSVLMNCSNSNPLFVNAADGDGTDNRWATTDDGLALQSISPAKDFGLTGSGIPSLDIIGVTRDATPDLGAYEYATPCVNPTTFRLSGGGSYCEGGIGHVIIVLGSELGVSYQLKNNGSNVGTSLSGTGFSLGFGNQTAAGTYTVVATRTVGGCSTTMTGSVTITINPNITPTFTAVNPICSGETLSTLPTTSNNGITGTWLPALNNTQTTIYTFTPTSEQCATTANLTITVNPNITPTFTAVNPICSGETLAALPTTSNNGVNGTWSPALDNTQTTTYTFTPSAGQCATPTTLTITVNPNITPTFTAVNPICSGATLAALPTTSNNGITGTWSPSLDNTQTTTYTFTPTAGQCATTASVTITVNPNTTPTFTAVNPICSGATLAALPTTSNNGINGTWSPDLNNTQTTIYTFTPTSEQCATTASLTITVNPNITPTFTDVNPICSGATLAALPTTSNNGINGTWSPDLDNTQTTTYTFTPTPGQCATTASLTITVNTNITPTFTAVNPICSGATLAALPTTSNNGINGTWSPALDNTQTTTYTFTPTSEQCATTASLTVIVNTNITPTFSAVNPICSGETISALPTTSNNGINGTWSPALNNAQTTTYTFTPTPGQCAITTTATINVNVTAAPTGTTPQDACSTGTLADLQVNGTDIIWYSTPLGNEVLPLSTILVRGATYYASQTVLGCESKERFSVTNTGSCLNVDSFSELKLKYLPNPVTTNLIVSSDKRIETYKLISSIGQLLRNVEVNAQDFEIDMSTLQSGIYLLRLSSDRKSKTIKIIKN